jgi:hypothetical protein
VSNELSNYFGVSRQPCLDDPGSIGASAIEIDDHLACFTPMRSLVRTQYRPRIDKGLNRGLPVLDMLQPME